jgi:hypothetical protein
MASRERVKRLNKVDLPTLGRPTSAMTGFIFHSEKVNPNLLSGNRNFERETRTKFDKSYEKSK